MKTTLLGHELLNCNSITQVRRPAFCNNRFVYKMSLLLLVFQMPEDNLDLNMTLQLHNLIIPLSAYYINQKEAKEPVFICRPSRRIACIFKEEAGKGVRGVGLATSCLSTVPEKLMTGVLFSFADCYLLGVTFLNFIS